MNKKNNHKKPPRFAQWLMGHILHDEKWKTPLGDFEEYYNYECKERGVFKARLWYWGQILKLMPQKISKSIYWSSAMFNNQNRIPQH